MRVTNEQVKVVCMKPSVLIDDTNLNFVWSDDLALDLLEARELIKEMREELREVLVSRERGEAKEMVFITNFAEIESILERTNEYQ